MGCLPTESKKKPGNPREVLFLSFRCGQCRRIVRYRINNTPALALCPSCMEQEIGMTYDPQAERTN